MSLFREEALRAEKEKWLGNVILTTPIKLKIFVVFVLLTLVALAIFVTTFSFTRKQTITGQLVPDLGLIKVYSPQYGVVTSVKVKEGDRVLEGDVLYTISSDRDGSSTKGVQQVISNEIKSRVALLQNELVKLKEQSEIDRSALEKNISQSMEQLVVQEKQAENYKKIIQLVERRQKQYQDLYKKNYISLEQVERVKEEYLSGTLNLNNIQRDILTIEKELSSRRSELAGLDVKYKQQLSQYERNLSQLQQELLESESRREIAIKAPQAGTITAVVAQVGQYADGKRQLLSIIPRGSRLVAHLYAPSDAVGFVHSGSEVLLRYQAYPYQKFGQYHGVIKSISKTALPKTEMTDLISANEYNPNISLYRIEVKLDHQKIQVYGKDKPLQAGMLLEADVVLDKRKLYEWVFEPLFTISGKF